MTTEHKYTVVLGLLVALLLTSGCGTPDGKLAERLRVEKAIVWFTKAIDLDPKRSDLFLGRVRDESL